MSDDLLYKKRKDYPPKTEGWQAAESLAKDKTFPMKKGKVILMFLRKLQYEMPEYIQIRKPARGYAGLCLHRNGWNLFLEKVGNEQCPPKTEEWQSAQNLRDDKLFPMGDTIRINKKLRQFQNEMPEYIQMRKPRTCLPCLCLHRDGRALFVEKAGLRYYPPKTNEWQSARDLDNDKTFPLADMKTINKKLQEIQSKMPEYIQIRKPGSGSVCLCLHRDGRDLFLKKVGYRYYPPKTADWQSASDLCADKTFPMSNKINITQKLELLQKAMPKYIQIRKPVKGPLCLCLHRDGRELFLEKSNENGYPSKKTSEWLSAVDLQQDKNFPMGNTTIINKKFEKFQKEMPEYIQIRKPAKGRSCLCLHRDGRQEFIRRVKKDKQESLGRGKAVVSAMNEMRYAKIISNKQHEK
ncbi:MAG: hypothetical protein J5679_01015 [Alphaproteobacteria bacterium]|nr:hypothetical protein [Alphaproteobacteria bacterium]